jgi:hypothetical protein
MAHPAPFIIQDTTDIGSNKKDQKIVQGMLAFVLIFIESQASLYSHSFCHNEAEFVSS